jgi:hypothetical protein
MSRPFDARCDGVTFELVRESSTYPDGVRNGMRALLQLLNEQPLLEVLEDTEWDAVFELAKAEHILPWTLHRFTEAAPHASSHLQSRVRELRRESAIDAFFWCSELKSLLQTFASASIPIIPLKGPALAERVYGGAANRSNRDLDILVRRSDLPHAQKIMRGLAFTSAGPVTYHQSWRRSGVMVELHHDVALRLDFNFHIESAWSQATQSQFQGVPCWKLARDDEALFLAIHAARDEFSRLNVLLDLALMYRDLGGQYLDVARPETNRLKGVSQMAYILAQRLQPDHLTPLSLSVIADKPEFNDLASQLERKLICLQPGRPLAWNERQRFHRVLETSTGGSLLRKGEQVLQLVREAVHPQLAKRDFVFAERFGIRKHWQVKLARYVRLMRRSK